MASLSPPRRSDDSDDDDYDRLMSAVTPVFSPARTRKRNANHLDSDHLDSDDVPPSSLNLALQRVNGNHLESIIAFANRKRLRPDQIIAVETHAGDPLPVQLSKIYVLGLTNENALAKFQAVKPTFEINSALKTNITRAVNATLCSSNISQYRGETGKNVVQRWSTWQIVHKFDTHHLSSHPTFAPCSSSWTQAELDPAGVHWTESLDST
ncbi:hypothetical protein B0H14DRAFT_2615856 [Mycena olivaceomarginata]|nr:hypothetical protein B0H14DRAFT_2615856 [Mycena olivaceomarginata]